MELPVPGCVHAGGLEAGREAEYTPICVIQDGGTGGGGSNGRNEEGGHC